MLVIYEYPALERTVCSIKRDLLARLLVLLGQAWPLIRVHGSVCTVVDSQMNDQGRRRHLNFLWMPSLRKCCETGRALLVHVHLAMEGEN